MAVQGIVSHFLINSEIMRLTLITFRNVTGKELLLSRALVMYLIFQIFAFPCDVTAFIHNAAAPAFFRKCYSVLRWEIGVPDFPEYRSLLPFVRDPTQEMFLNNLGMDCMCERGH